MQYGGYAFSQKLFKRYEQIRLKDIAKNIVQDQAAPPIEHVYFEASNRCNLHCRMCYQQNTFRVKKDDLSYGQLMPFLESISAIPKMTISGGEFTLRQDCCDLISTLNQKHELVLCTNGTLMTTQLIEVIAQAKNVHTVCISLDGPQLIHDKIRGLPGAYQKTIQAISVLNQVLPVTVNCVVLEDNIQYLGELLSIAKGLGVQKVRFEMERPSYGPQFPHQERIETNVLKQQLQLFLRKRSYSEAMFHECITDCLQKARQMSLHIEFAPFFLHHDLSNTFSYTHRQVQTLLCQRLSTATVDSSGNVLFCPHLRVTFGNIITENLEQIWKSDKFKKFRLKLVEQNLFPICENCTSLVPRLGSWRWFE